MTTGCEAPAVDCSEEVARAEASALEERLQERTRWARDTGEMIAELALPYAFRYETTPPSDPVSAGDEEGAEPETGEAERERSRRAALVDTAQIFMRRSQRIRALRLRIRGAGAEAAVPIYAAWPGGFDAERAEFPTSELEGLERVDVELRVGLRAADVVVFVEVYL